MSLQARLMASYVVIILVTLTLTFVTLVVVARPVQSRLTQFRLARQAQRAALLINQLYDQGQPTDRILAQVNTAATQQDFRLLFIDLQGNVRADSQGGWVGHPTAALKNGDGQAGGLIQAGFFDAPNGLEFQFAALPVGPADQPVGYVVVVRPRLSSALGLLTGFGWGLVTAGAVALLVSLLLGVLIARSIARPLQHIAAAAGAATAGHYEQRLQESGPLEIKRVAASFNVMMDRVERSQRAMRDFVSNVSHELKTPLTSIQGFSQAIMDGATQDEAGRRRAAIIIHQEASRMARMVEDLLDLARIDSGQVAMAKTPLELERILTNTVERLLPQAAQKQIELVSKWSNLPTVVGDGDRLAQVFTNLLDNAVRHTPPGGRVVVSGRAIKGLPRPQRGPTELIAADATTALSERGEFVEISIADTGPGIPSDELARIFERFYQVDKSRKRGRGTGLGLAITTEIVEAHGGSIRAESMPGRGTKFIVLLPVTEADVRTLVSPQRKHI